MVRLLKKSVVMRWTVVLGLALLMAVPAYGQQERGLKAKKDSLGTDGLLYQDKYALIVGINEYQDSNLRNLQYAVSDAEAIRSILIDGYHFPEDNVILLKDKRATREDIMASLSRYIEDDIEENSQLLVYFAGHGTTIGNEFNQLGYLLPHDAKIGSQRETYSTGIPMDDIQRISRALRPKHVLFLMDACYGGLANARAAKSSVFVRDALDRNARQLITAGSADEEVVESAEWGHSALTKVLIDALDEGLADGNDDGIIPAIELFNYIEQRVPYFAEDQGGKQTPQYSKLTPDDGTFLFIRDEDALSELLDDDESLLDLDSETIARRFTTPISIIADVDNARVYLEGKEIGYLSRGAFKYDLSPGFYKIELKKEKYESAAQEVEVLPDTSMAIAFDMEYTYSLVHFDVKPEDAAVYINDQYIGSGSFREELPKGHHKVVVSKSGFRPDTSNVNLTLDSTQIMIELEFIQTRLELRSIPEGALVVVNGDTSGFTPLQVSLGYGTHDIYLEKERYRDQYISFDIKDSRVVSETVKMRETPEVIARRTYNRRLFKRIRSGVFSGMVAGGAYVGYKRLDMLEKETDEDDRNRTAYEAGKYITLGLAGLLAGNGLYQLLKAGTLKYDKILEEQLELEVNEQVSVKMGILLGFDGVGMKAMLSL